MANNLRVLVLGADGYLGWPVTCELIQRGHRVMGIDAGFRRLHYEYMVEPTNVDDYRSLVPIDSFPARKAVFSHYQGMWNQDITQEGIIQQALYVFSPDVILHMAEISSRAFTMASEERAASMVSNNTMGMARLIAAVRDHKPATHIIKISSINTHLLSRDFCTATLQATSATLRIACNVQNLRAQEIETGLIYGTRCQATQTLEMKTRFDYTANFGGVIHRFIVQAAQGKPITIHGDGTQQVGIIHLEDVTRYIATAVDHSILSAKSTFERGTLIESCCCTQMISVNKIAGIIIGALRVRNLQVPDPEFVPNPRGGEEQVAFSMPLDCVPNRGIRFTEMAVHRILEDISPFLDRVEIKDVNLRESSWRR